MLRLQNDQSAWLKADARSEYRVLIRGARDPSLPALAKKIMEMFGGKRRRP